MRVGLCTSQRVGVVGRAMRHTWVGNHISRMRQEVVLGTRVAQDANDIPDKTAKLILRFSCSIAQK